MGYYISGFTDDDFDVRESYRDIRLFHKDGKFVRATMPTGTKPFYKELKVVEVKTPHGHLVDIKDLQYGMLKGKVVIEAEEK